MMKLSKQVPLAGTMLVLGFTAFGCQAPVNVATLDNASQVDRVAKDGLKQWTAEDLKKFGQVNENKRAEVSVAFVNRIKADRSVRKIGQTVGPNVTTSFTVPTWEIRAMYTEAVVRSVANLADYHVGVKALPNSITGYSINLPQPGANAGAGAPRLRYAQHPTLDDPMFADLNDGTEVVNPVAGAGIYFLGNGILKTAFGNGFPPVVADVFSPLVSSTVVGSINDAQNLKLGVGKAESLFNPMWTAGVSYTDNAAVVQSMGPTVQDRLLTDNITTTTSRYYKWRFPADAQGFTLGNGLPLGRVVLDMRYLNADGSVAAFGYSQMLLQQGQNDMTVTLYNNDQGLADIDVTLPPP